MESEPVHFTGPDGAALVIMTRERFEKFSVAERQAEARGAFIGRDLPQAVLDSIASGMSPLAAWRMHRGLKQTELAARTGVHRITIIRMEAAGAGAGRRETRQLLADALGIPISAL